MALLVQLQKGRILSELGYLKGSVVESYGLVCPVFVRGTESGWNIESKTMKYTSVGFRLGETLMGAYEVTFINGPCWS